MAKKKAKLSISAPSQTTLATAAEKEDEYQKEDDARRIRDYAKLVQDKARHQKALDHINNEHRAMRSIIGGESDSDDAGINEGSVQPRTVARQGRKKSVRVPRSSGRR